VVDVDVELVVGSLVDVVVTRTAVVVEVVVVEVLDVVAADVFVALGSGGATEVRADDSGSPEQAATASEAARHAATSPVRRVAIRRDHTNRPFAIMGIEP